MILPSCLDFTVVHRLLRQTSTCRDHGRNELCDRRLCLDHGQTGSQLLLKSRDYTHWINLADPGLMSVIAMLRQLTDFNDC